MIRILCLGDVVGEEGVRFLEKDGRLRKLIAAKKADLTVVNGENSAPGNGISKESAERLLDAGADVITGGNHTWKLREIYGMLDDGEALLRPCNYPPEAPGMGYLIAEARGYRILVLNACGVVYMDPVEPPAGAVARILKAETVRMMREEALLRKSGGAAVWGLGMMIRERPGEMGSACPPGAYGWSGAFGTHFVIDPSDGTSFVWVTNRTDLNGSGSYISAKMEELVFGN